VRPQRRGLAQAASPSRFARLPREDRLALWMVLPPVLALSVHGRIANPWSPDGNGLLRPAQAGLRKTEPARGVALAVPQRSPVGRLLRPEAGQVTGRKLTGAFAPWVHFSGIALAPRDREALLARERAAMLPAWMALAEPRLLGPAAISRPLRHASSPRRPRVAAPADHAGRHGRGARAAAGPASDPLSVRLRARTCGPGLAGRAGRSGGLAGRGSSRPPCGLL
jgi:hypothetical protein